MLDRNESTYGNVHANSLYYIYTNCIFMTVYGNAGPKTIFDAEEDEDLLFT